MERACWCCWDAGWQEGAVEWVRGDGKGEVGFERRTGVRISRTAPNQDLDLCRHFLPELWFLREAVLGTVKVPLICFCVKPQTLRCSVALPDVNSRNC